MLTHAVRIHETGGVDKLIYENVTLRNIKSKEVVIKNTAIGVNFIDTYFRSGLYPLEHLPAVLGQEGVGIVESIGTKVKDFVIGDRVAYCDPIGSYSHFLIRPADRLVKLPAEIDDNIAASIMTKGLTAIYLARKTYRVKKNDFVLIHAASGGVGQILCQLTKSLGAKVIGVVGSESKVKTAFEVGCHHVINSQNQNFVEEVKKITKNKGVDVVYDGNGKSTFEDSLDCIKPHGMMVSFGNASGAVENFNITTLAKKGSIYLARPTLNSYISKRKDLIKLTKELFSYIKKGVIKVNVNHIYALKDARRAHQDLEDRKTTGSIILIP